MSERQEMVMLVLQGGVSRAELARRFGISRKTLYKWIARYRQSGSGGLSDRCRRPRHCPHRTATKVADQVLALREQHPFWGGRKLHHRLRQLGQRAPAPSTITRILSDHGRIAPADSARRHRWQRFERSSPNDLWQMDFKGPVTLSRGGCSHPLTVVDDHSRYALSLHACANQQMTTVREQLCRLFDRYGLPQTILTDNGVPWCTPGINGLTRLEVWLMRLDVRVIHGRPYHPQTQGKEERFHRTLSVELLQDRSFADQAALQAAFDPWREVYNHQRPHESLGYATPGQRYRCSARRFTATLPAVRYDAGDQLRRVDASGLFVFHRRRLRAGKALAGESVALRPTLTDGLWKVYYSRFPIGHVDLRTVGPGQFAHVFRSGPGRYAPCATAENVDVL